MSFSTIFNKYTHITTQHLVTSNLTSYKLANIVAIHPTIGKYISDQEDYVHRANITDNPLYITCGFFSIHFIINKHTQN